MKGFRLPVLGLAVAAVLGSGAAMAQSDSTARGRAVFDKKGCQYCHSYVSRRGAPAVRDMLRDFEGEPQRVLKGIGAVSQHGDVLRSGKISDADQRLIAEWLGGDFLPEADDAGEEAAAPAAAARASVAASSVAAAPAAMPAAVPAVPAVVAKVAPDSRTPAVTTVTPVSGPAVSAIRLQSLGAKGGERLIVELRGGEPASVDLSLVDNRLVMSFVGAGLANVPARIEAEAAFKLIGSVDAKSDGRTATITVVPREAGWTYSGMQGRNRMVVDFTAQPKAAVAARSPVINGSVAKSGAGKSAAAGAALAGGASMAAGTATTGAGVVASAKAGKKAVEKAAAKAAASKVTASAPTGEKPVAAQQKTPDSKLAQQAAAEQKAAEQAKAQELARKAEQARAAEQAKAREQAEAAKRAKLAEEDAARKREQERAAEVAKAPATALAKAAPMAEDVPQEAGSGKERRKLKKNRPYKEPNLGPCPPPNPADQVIGVVDVERAKDIIDRIGCPQCHAYVQKKTGPPFREVLKKYKGDPACVIHRLKTNETHKDEGVTADIRPDEFKILADYVATRMK